MVKIVLNALWTFCSYDFVPQKRPMEYYDLLKPSGGNLTRKRNLRAQDEERIDDARRVIGDTSEVG